MANPFIGREPTLEDLWRAIVLYGRNVASYKFALASSLLELRPEEGDLVRLEDLSGPFSRHLMTHLARADKQATSPSSKFLDALRMGLAGELSEQQVIEQTTRLGFVNVIDAFHVVGSGDVPERFFLDERAQNGGIRITEDFSRLAAGAQIGRNSVGPGCQPHTPPRIA